MLDSDSDDDDKNPEPLLDSTEELPDEQAAMHVPTDAHSQSSHDSSTACSKAVQQSQHPEAGSGYTSSAKHQFIQPSGVQGRSSSTVGSVQNSSEDIAGLFQLTAAVVHHGSSSGSGHYTVYRCVRHSSVQQSGAHDLGRSKSQWFSISDEHVQPVSVSEVLACEATLLLYNQCR